MTERSLEELIDASHAFCDAVDQIERLTTEVASKDKKIEFLKEQLNQLANFNPDWDMLEAAQGSLRDHMKIIERLTAEGKSTFEAGYIAGFAEGVTPQHRRLGIEGKYQEFATATDEQESR